MKTPWIKCPYCEYNNVETSQIANGSNPISYCLDCEKNFIPTEYRKWLTRQEYRIPSGQSCAMCEKPATLLYPAKQEYPLCDTCFEGKMKFDLRLFTLGRTT